MIKLFLLLFSLLVSLSSIAQVGAVGAQINQTHERKKLFEQLRDDILSEKKCLGMGFVCIRDELIKLEIKTSNDLSFGSNILAHILQRKLKEDGCALICRNDYQAQFMDALLSYLESFSLKKTAAYAGELPQTMEGKLMRATEDLLFYKQIESIHLKTSPIVLGIDPSKIINPESASRARTLEGRMKSVKSNVLLSESYLKDLKGDDPVLKNLVRAGGKNPAKAKEYLQLIRDFRKNI
jgi:hypothetical protein